MPVNNINKAIRMIDASLKEGEEADKEMLSLIENNIRVVNSIESKIKILNQSIQKFKKFQYGYSPLVYTQEAVRQLENAVYGALDALEKGKNGL